MMKVILILAGVLALAVANAEEKSTEKTPEKPSGKTVEKTQASAHSEKAEKSAHKKSAETNEAASENLPKDVKKLIIQDTIAGAGKIATKGKTITVNYTGWLYDPMQPMGRGKQFDSSVGREPFTFKLGEGKVIKGWDDGFANMKVGGKRKLIIPSAMGYGARGAGSVIPPNSPLMFEVELIDVM